MWSAAWASNRQSSHAARVLNVSCPFKRGERPPHHFVQQEIGDCVRACIQRSSPHITATTFVSERSATSPDGWVTEPVCRRLSSKKATVKETVALPRIHSVF